MTSKKTVDERFDMKVSQAGPDDCWEWRAHRMPRGYGTFLGEGRVRYLAHRYAFQREHGPIPKGMCVLHKCDNPCCVNVNHLFMGTQADNMRDMREKGRGSAPPVLRGEDANGSTLKNEQVREIRRLYAAGGVTQKVMADMFGVSQANIEDIVYRRTWAHITD